MQKKHSIILLADRGNMGIGCTGTFDLKTHSTKVKAMTELWKTKMILVSSGVTSLYRCIN